MSPAEPIYLAGAFAGVICLGCIYMRWRGSCTEALYGAWASGIAAVILLCITSAAMRQPAQTSIEGELLYLCKMESECDVPALARILLEHQGAQTDAP